MDNPLGNKDLTNKTLGGQFKLIRRLGMGAFGEIYLAVNKNKEEFAIKIERVKCEFPQIMYESKVYAILHANKPVGIPKIFGANTEGDYNYLTMELLGSSIEDIFISCGRKLQLKSVLMLADQMITRIELLHSSAFIHRDIKPDNFLMGINQNQHKLYVVDMGLVKKYITREGHIPYKEGKPLTGTARYASINAHLGYEQSRRDDLEGLAYVLVYLAKGQLPWMNLKSVNQNDKYEKIKDKKIKTTPEELCKGLPIEINQYLNYIRKLKFEERPDYEMCRQLFKNAMKANNLTYDYKFEWIKGKYEIQPQKSNIQTSPEKTIIQPVQQVKAPQKVQSPPKKQVQVPAAQIQSPRVNNPKQQVPLKRIQSPQRPQQKNLLPQKPTQPVIVQAPRIVLNKEPYTKY